MLRFLSRMSGHQPPVGAQSNGPLKPPKAQVATELSCLSGSPEQLDLDFNQNAFQHEFEGSAKVKFKIYEIILKIITDIQLLKNSLSKNIEKIYDLVNLQEIQYVFENRNKFINQLKDLNIPNFEPIAFFDLLFFSYAKSNRKATSMQSIRSVIVASLKHEEYKKIQEEKELANRKLLDSISENEINLISLEEAIKEGADPNYTDK